MAKNKLTLRELIVNECANWVANRCVKYDGACIVLIRKERCAYFEKAIVKGTSLYPEWIEAVAKYEKMTQNKDAERNLRRCECGKVLGPRQRFCALCAAKRRKNSYRESKRDLRGRGFNS